MLALAGMETAGLVELITSAQEFHRRLAEFERAVSDEILRHLDQNATWTLRVGDYEVKAPSPTAGTESYPPDALETELAGLIEEGVISDSAATKACQRRLVLELAVPWSASHRDLAKTVKDAIEIEVAGVPVKVLKAEPGTRPVAAGISALRKVAGTSEALDRAKVLQPQGARKTTVKRREG
jgi:hypothetical protein